MWMKNCKNIFRDFVYMVYTLLTIVYFKSLFKNDGTLFDLRVPMLHLARPAASPVHPYEPSFSLHFQKQTHCFDKYFSTYIL